VIPTKKEEPSPLAGVGELHNTQNNKERDIEP